MTRKTIVAANWKMNTTLAQGIELFHKINVLFKGNSFENRVIVLLCPPFTHLAVLKKLLIGTPLNLGAQNMHFEEKGAFTGEISASMLLDTGCSYVIIGHSERRQYFKEDNQILAKKIRTALKNNLSPIYCCGETLEEREQNLHFDVIRNQIKEGLFKCTEEEIGQIAVAYEPVWAIGTGKTATPDQAQEIHHFIRGLIAEKYGNERATEISIIYGGSIKATNAVEIFKQEDIDGGLVGGASLDANEFISIINAAQ